MRKRMLLPLTRTTVRLAGLLLMLGLFAPPAQSQDLPPEILGYADPDRQPMFNLQILTTRRTSDGRIFGLLEKIDRPTGLLMMAGPRTTRVDLNGRAVMPGVINTHAHLYEYAIYKHALIIYLKQVQPCRRANENMTAS